VSKEPQSAHPITRAFNTYKMLTEQTAYFEEDGGDDYQHDGDILTPIPEDMFVYRVGMFHRVSRTYNGEAVATLLLVPGLAESLVCEAHFRNHRVTTIPLGQDEYPSVTRDTQRIFNFPYEAWIFLEKGDSVMWDWKVYLWENGGVAEVGSMLFQLFGIVKG